MASLSMPWEDKPQRCRDPLWRSQSNPIIDRYAIPTSNSIFNSAVVRFGNEYRGVFRCDNKAVQMNIFAGRSLDGLKWTIEHKPVKYASTSHIRSVLLLLTELNVLCLTK
jgi:beta-1,4-mannooligosaccharide/beta-1,4-mannosyl-N-acetylglucosamine phosphorylase